MVGTNAGFEIAEADMRLRGPGDIEGTAQSGLPFDLKIADLAKDGEILMLARDTAEKILKNDPALSNKLNEILLIQLHKKSKNIIDWSKIS
jgi:ATP-dependent DNA helicase RecG